MTIPTQSGTAVGHDMITVRFHGLSENALHELLHENTKVGQYEFCDAFADRDAAREMVKRLRFEISAKGDLLEVLQRAVACGMVPTTSALDGGAASYSEQVRTADAIRAAIAKATEIKAKS